MRILHIGKYYPPAKGGMERFLGDLVCAQRAAGHDAAVLVHADPNSSGKRDPDWVLRCPVWGRLLFAPLGPFPLWLSRALGRWRPEILHLHMPNVSAFWALLLPASRKIPWVVHWHSDVELSRRTLRVAYPHYHIFERALLERADLIIATSPQYVEASQPLHPWRHKVRVIPLGVDPARLSEVDPRDTVGLWLTGGLRVLAVGRLTYYKSFETLLRAVIGDAGKELVIIGEGEERANLESVLAKAGGPASIRLLGEADDTTLRRYMASCDVFCLPSRERTEAFGIVLLEAMRYAKPLVASALPGSGVSWVAREGQNAVMIPPDDAAALRAALDALAASPAKRHLLGRLGYERYLREFDIAAVERRIEDAYRLALNMRADDGVAPRPSTRASVAPLQRSERLLIVIPALNEARDIGGVIEQVRALGKVDVLVVDDGSTDDTAAVARLSGAIVLRAPLWQGAWGAIQTGIRHAVRHGYAGVVTMDADGQHEPAYLPQMLEAAGGGADIVIAACPARGSRLRHIAWSYFRMLTGFELDDLTSGFRYYNARSCSLLAAQEATLLDYQDIGVLLLLRNARLRIAEIHVAMNPRRHGASRVFSSWWTVGVYMMETSLLCLARWGQVRKARLPMQGQGK